LPVQMLMQNEPRCPSARRGLRTTYSWPRRLPPGSHRASSDGSSLSAARLTGLKSIRRLRGFLPTDGGPWMYGRSCQHLRMLTAERVENRVAKPIGRG
jgi:hypothetical protein